MFCGGDGMMKKTRYEYVQDNFETEKLNPF